MSRSIVHFAATNRSGKSASRFSTEDREYRRKRRRCRPGYPIENMLTPQEAIDYLESDPMACLLCGRTFQALGRHVTAVHDMTVRHYCTKYAIPYRLNGGTGLATNRERWRRSQTAKAVPGLVERVSQIHRLSPNLGKYKAPMSRENLAVRVYMSKTAPRTCPECGDTFRPSHATNTYCSKSCARAAQSRSARTTWRDCLGCGKQLPPSSQHLGVKRCRSCHYRLRRGADSTKSGE